MKKIMIFLKIVLIPAALFAQELTPEMVSNSGWYKSEYVGLDRNYQGGKDIKDITQPSFI